jgi:hypothetical protein
MAKRRTRRFLRRLLRSLREHRPNTVFKDPREGYGSCVWVCVLISRVRPKGDNPKRAVAQRWQTCFTRRIVIWAVVSTEIEQAIELFPTRDEADQAVALMLGDEPDWRDVLHRLG